MRLELLQAAALVLAAATVIWMHKQHWIQAVAIGELVGSVISLLLYADLLSLPWPASGGYIALVMFLGWVAVLVAAKDKPTLIAGAIAAWVAASRGLLELGWVRLDLIRQLLN